TKQTEGRNSAAGSPIPNEKLPTKFESKFTFGSAGRFARRADNESSVFVCTQFPNGTPLLGFPRIA
ncbi:hypothetical protein, partial [Mesorhizobium sp.]|uniref:hypothetical protein n=1 Tax=Mesorhizobium sp. TaxID=1871066 RepID=UPI0025C6D240